MRQCDGLRKRLETWRGFDTESNNNWPVGEVGIVWVDGTASFDTGIYRMRMDWNLHNGRAQLFNLQVDTGVEQRIVIPASSDRLQ